MNTKIPADDPRLKIAAQYALHCMLVDNNSLPSCVNCNHWNKIQSLCEKFQMNPPPEIIVKSCGYDNWEPGIPF
jgi:hypothetical protein